MRTLEDWFKYLEQQYVEEEPQTTVSEQQTAKSEHAKIEPIALETHTAQEAMNTLPVSSLQRIQVPEEPVPDPADYIFTLRRSTLTPKEATSQSGAAQPAEQTLLEEPQGEEKQEQPDADEVVTPVAQAQEAQLKTAEPTQPEEEQLRRRRGGASTKRAPYTRSVRPVPPPQSVEEMWNRVPKHVRLLVEIGDDEVTQQYYHRQFKETRRELVERLLNPPLTLEDTARLLGVCPTTVRRYTERGLLNHHRTPGNQRRFRLSDVIAFLEARQQAREARRRKR